MSIKNGKDFLYLIWKDPISRKQFMVGTLSKNGCYEFSYGLEVNEAIKRGFQLLISFEDLQTVYKNSILFPVFSSRLPDKKRHGIDKILRKYNMDEYDDYTLLKRSGARLPIDNLEFIDPIIDTSESDIKRMFFLAGPRYYIGCGGKNCDDSIDVIVGERVNLVPEPENKHDSNAIKVTNKENSILGYIPRYHSESIIRALDMGYNYTCIIREVQKNKCCNECMKVELALFKN